jgi:D-alanyl-D-alanine carboxypeptidase
MPVRTNTNARLFGCGVLLLMAAAHLAHAQSAYVPSANAALERALAAWTAEIRARNLTADQDNMVDAIAAGIRSGADVFLIELHAVAADEDMRRVRLVDKRRPLQTEVVPALFPIGGLLPSADSARTLMAKAAATAGVKLFLGGSCYRSLRFQEETWVKLVTANIPRNAVVKGPFADISAVLEAARGDSALAAVVDWADSVSSRPGRSQHHLAIACDFSSTRLGFYRYVTGPDGKERLVDVFRNTSAGLWLAKNAARFGWSQSYPALWENVTGYAPESWHYLFIGQAAAAFQERWFASPAYPHGIQALMLEFLAIWQKENQ